MSNEVVKTAATGAVMKSDKSIKGMLANPDTAWGKELAKVLPTPSAVARFMACAMNQLADPKVGSKLATCTLPSFYNSIMKSARSGILPDGVNAYLIPYGTECTLQYSYRGLCDMAIREKIAMLFKADIVRENDEWEWAEAEVKKHRITGWSDEERGEIKGVWVGALLPNEHWVYERMSYDDVEKVRRCSKNSNGVWSEWWEEMAKKSCVKRLFKKMQNTPAMSEVIADDNEGFDLNKKQFDRSNRVTADDLLAGASDVPTQKPEEKTNGKSIDEVIDL